MMGLKKDSIGIYLISYSPFIYMIIFAISILVLLLMAIADQGYILEIDMHGFLESYFEPILLGLFIFTIFVSCDVFEHEKLFTYITGGRVTPGGNIELYFNADLEDADYFDLDFNGILTMSGHTIAQESYNDRILGVNPIITAGEGTPLYINLSVDSAIGTKIGELEYPGPMGPIRHDIILYPDQPASVATANE